MGSNIIQELELPKDDNGFTLDTNGNPVHFKGDSSLSYRQPKLPITEKHIEEIRKCINSPIYFIETYTKIRSLDKGFITPKLRPYQIRILNALVENRFVLVMAGRQIGKSITTILYLLWKFTFCPDSVIGICANKEAMAKENLDRLASMYRDLPIWLKPSVNSFNKKSLSNDIGCKVYSSSTTPSAFRGFQIGLLFLDECVGSDTLVTIRDNITGEIKKLSIEELYNLENVDNIL